MKADDILKKHEDANEMHFHEVDRKWVIEAMEEYAALRQPLVISSVCEGCRFDKKCNLQDEGRFKEICRHFEQTDL